MVRNNVAADVLRRPVAPDRVAHTRPLDKTQPVLRGHCHGLQRAGVWKIEADAVLYRVRRRRSRGKSRRRAHALKSKGRRAYLPLWRREAPPNLKDLRLNSAVHQFGARAVRGGGRRSAGPDHPEGGARMRAEWQRNQAQRTEGPSTGASTRFARPHSFEGGSQWPQGRCTMAAAR